MTREEIDKAIKNLKFVMAHLDDNSEMKKSYKLAIEALKAEHCVDEEVIKIIAKSREVAQALNEFADNLERIEERYAKP